ARPAFAAVLRRLRGRVPRRLLRAVGDRREHRADALRGDPARRARALAPRLAAAALVRDHARARGALERDAARGVLREGRRGPRWQAGGVATRGRLPARAPDARIS